MAANPLENITRPENTEYDKMRWDSTRLKRNGLYGLPKIFVNGLKPSPWCDCGCGMRKVWCPRKET